MARHDEIGRLFADGVYFAYPGRPWERASNDNTNGLLRQYFPKRSDLALHTPEDLAAVADRLNNGPRKTLAWMAPAQVSPRHYGPERPSVATVVRIRPG